MVNIPGDSSDVPLIVPASENPIYNNGETHPSSRARAFCIRIMENFNPRQHVHSILSWVNSRIEEESERETAKNLYEILSGELETGMITTPYNYLYVTGNFSSNYDHTQVLSNDRIFTRENMDIFKKLIFSQTNQRYSFRKTHERCMAKYVKDS